METLLQLFTALLQFWVSAPLPIAFAMAVSTNIIIYVSTAFLLDTLIKKLTAANGPCKYIDERDLKPNQVQNEIKHSLIACAVFALTSLVSREIYHQLWPATLAQLAIQFIVFTLFYETYSYLIHRLLHTPWFRRIHRVHHWSVRITPWSAYSVHFVEALFIGISAPLFMLIFPMDLGVIFGFHILGMMFTVFIHSNFTLKGDKRVTEKLGHYALYHRAHHLIGTVNFGFTHSFWDKCFGTKQK